MEDAGEYNADVYATPANPVYKNNMLRYGICVAGRDVVFVNTVAPDYAVGDDKDEWKQGVRPVS